jgi:DNA-binding HxlR family transcriptional regulator
MASYGEYCPIAVGVEMFGDRWTPLVLRELIIGSTRFNDIHRGLPKMNRTLLAQRLRLLERRGLVERHGNERANGVSYRLTEAGRALEPVIWAIGQWAAEWSIGDPTDDQLDAHWLVWRLHQYVVDDRLPETRTVVEVKLSGPGAGRGWLVLDRGSSTACLNDPGYEVDLHVFGDNRQMHRWLLGVIPFRDVLANGDVELIGSARLARAFPTWFDTSKFAPQLAAARRRERRRVNTGSS